MAASSHPTRRDIAILRFLAAAELIETDLWQQYAELAHGNPRYREALETIDDDLPVYAIDVTEDELSHAEFINAYLRSIGAEPVNLDRFRVIASPPVTGLRQIGRLTNLTDLTVNTSYFRRYQSTRNPDFGATFDQIATIRDQPAIPTSNSVGDQALAGIVRVAAFHFAWVEQGGTSLYDQFVPYISSREVLRIVSSIYATEAVHYAIFRNSLNGITAFQNGTQAGGARSHRRQAGLVPRLPQALHIPERATSDLLGHPPFLDRSGRRAGGGRRLHGLESVQGPAAGLLPGAHGLGQGRRRRRLSWEGSKRRAVPPPAPAHHADRGGRISDFLTHADLRELGLPLGPRKVLLKGR